MRAILDSKFNEHISCENYRCISKFPEFVYNWFSIYSLDKVKRHIVLNK